MYYQIADTNGLPTMNAEQTGFRIEVLEVVEWQMANGEAAFVMFLNITNLEPKARLITLSSGTYVTKDGEQLEQDIWVTGYLIQHGRINACAHRKSGLVFYKSHLGAISQGDRLLLEVVIPDKARKLSLQFENVSALANMHWAVCGSDIEEYDVKPTPRVASKALTKRIERLEALEERFGIVLEKLSVNVSDDYNQLEVAGEVHLASGDSLARSIEVFVAAYDSEGSIIKTGSAWLDSQKFAGFDVFSISLYAVDIALLTTKLRVFPKVQ